jgi:hypothetical protein
MTNKIVSCLIVASSCINYSIGINKPHIKRCNSSPNLRLLYNTTSTSLTTTTYDVNNNIISYDAYKSIIYNKYKRNLYLRSKEKYTLDDAK